MPGGQQAWKTGYHMPGAIMSLLSRRPLLWSKDADGMRWKTAISSSLKLFRSVHKPCCHNSIMMDTVSPNGYLSKLPLGQGWNQNTLFVKRNNNEESGKLQMESHFWVELYGEVGNGHSGSRHTRKRPRVRDFIACADNTQKYSKMTYCTKQEQKLE